MQLLELLIYTASAHISSISMKFFWKFWNFLGNATDSLLSIFSSCNIKHVCARDINSVSVVVQFRLLIFPLNSSWKNRTGMISLIFNSLYLILTEAQYQFLRALYRGGLLTQAQPFLPENRDICLVLVGASSVTLPLGLLTSYYHDYLSSVYSKY